MEYAIQLEDMDLVKLVKQQRPELKDKCVEITERHLDNVGGIKLYFKVD